MFNTKYERQVLPKEKNSGEIITEQQFVSTEKEIGRLITSGQRLAAARKFDFENPNEVDESFYDPTRESDFDLSDVTSISHELESRILDKKQQETEEVQETHEVQETEQKTTPKEE